MAKKADTKPQNPLILRFHRLMDAFAKSDDERDFYLDTLEGFLIFADLDKSLEELDRLEKELQESSARFRLIPKMTFYETKKFMEGFVNEKVYDIDTKEKLLDIIGSKEARENFLEFIYDHLTELEKWQQYYHERSRIRIIEWLRNEEIRFAFEEDLDVTKTALEKVKHHLFDAKVPKDVQSARDAITAKSETYYSNEALNPRPKRGRPPKQAQKVELEPQYTVDIYKTVTPAMRPFLYNPDFTSTAVTFSAKFDTEAQLIASLRGSSRVKIDSKLEALSQRLESLRHLSDRLKGVGGIGGDSEEKLIQSVSHKGEEKGKISSIAKGFLPKKRGKAPKEKEEIQEMIQKKAEGGNQAGHSVETLEEERGRVVIMETTSAPLQDLLELHEKKRCTHALKGMIQARLMDEKMQKLVRQNKGGTFHLYTQGHEMIGVLSGQTLAAGKDWGVPYYRDRAFAIGLGCDLSEMFGAFLAREVPHHSGGRMMPDHFSHKELRIPCQSSVVGSQFLQAVGVAKAARLAETDEVVYVSGGDGSTSQGDFHEALNYSCIHKLGVIFVIQDNGWAISVPVEDQTAGGSIAHMARGYDGLSVHEIDGCDYSQVSKALTEAVQKGRRLEGPSLIVAKVPRIGAHSSSDDPKKYKNDDHFEEDEKKDPLPRFETYLIDHDILSAEEISKLWEETREEIEKAAAEGEAFPLQDTERVLDHVLAESPVEECQTPEERGESVVIMDALNHAIDEEMERDPGVIVFGQDVARGKGGVFGITRGLTDKFGEDRCFNTPLAESTIIGTAIGLSVHSHFKPVAEIQFADYLWTGFNQLYNELSNFHYRANGEWKCPIVVRMPTGGYIQGGPYHSQNIEAFLCHCPGLKVVMPSNAADAKMLLKSAIRDPNPVVFLEHKALYRQRVFSANPEPTKEEIIPLGKANIVREGSDVTLIAWGLMVHMAHDAAQKLEDEGISVEIVDLRTLSPLDFDTILKSIEKTSKALIVHEAPLTCGFGAEVAAQISEKAFELLDAPLKRLGAKDTCVPYAKHLEDAVLPQKGDLESALRTLATY